jgi:hypothetical protein
VAPRLAGCSWLAEAGAVVGGPVACMHMHVSCVVSPWVVTVLACLHPCILACICSPRKVAFTKGHVSAVGDDDTMGGICYDCQISCPLLSFHQLPPALFLAWVVTSSPSPFARAKTSQPIDPH